jgi:hypothetical protein|tara:strand:- start:1292 stop:1879 length:588 start_codon:yes stop_codon:yes gene_type:complete
MAETLETPLWWNEAWGPFNGVSDMKEVVRQLMKVLILTVPGENPAELDVNFGVGLRNVLFMNDHPSIRIDIESRIRNQINTYIRTGDTGQPMVRLLNVQFSPYPVNDAEPKLSVRIAYTVLLGTSESDVQEENIPEIPSLTDDIAKNGPGDFVTEVPSLPGPVAQIPAGFGNATSPIVTPSSDGLFGELKWKSGI